MRISTSKRAGIIAGVAAGALALMAASGAVAASAASAVNGGASATTRGVASSDSTTTGTTGTRTPEKELTGDAAAKVKAAVEAKYPGATVDRMEEDNDEGAVYEAHVTKADGTHVKVLLDASYAVTGESTRGPGGHSRTPEKELTGDAAAKVKAAVEAKYPGATVDRMEEDNDEGAVYEAHVTKADGTHVKVLLDASYAVTGESTRGPGGKGPHGGRMDGMGHGGQGGRGHHDQQGSAASGSSQGSGSSSVSGSSATSASAAQA